MDLRGDPALAERARGLEGLRARLLGVERDEHAAGRLARRGERAAPEQAPRMRDRPIEAPMPGSFTFEPIDARLSERPPLQTEPPLSWPAITPSKMMPV